MKYLFVFLTLVISLNSIAQSKKEQIAILTVRLDSLNNEYIKDTTLLSNTFQMVDMQYWCTLEQLDKAQEQLEKKSATISEKTNTIKSLNAKNIELVMELNKLRDSIAIIDVTAKYQGGWCYDKKWESDGQMLELSIDNASAFVDFGAANYFENCEVVYNANGSALFYLSFVSGSIGFMQSQGDAMNERINQHNNLAYSAVLIEANKIKIGEMELIKLKPNQGCGKYK